MNQNMDFNSSFNNDDSWFYNNGDSGHELEFNNKTLQEPVPFEDFKFSFGSSTNDLQLQPSTLIDPFLQEPFNFMTPATNTVLDENDQKAFSSFLDAFFMDSDMQFQQNHQSQTSDFYFNQNDEPQKEREDEEEHRRSSILQSLDEQKMLHQRLNLLATLPPSANTATATKPSTDHNSRKRIRSSSVTSTSEADNNATPQTIYLRRSDSITSPYTINTSTHQSSKKRSSSTAQLYPLEKENSKSNPGTPKKSRSTKELLTEEEKRANHIASEQKRRSTIRTGFKDLTDLIPTLKNINNSKSTVLFKAVDFIRYLEKRNKSLREKVGSLELRVEVEGRMTQTTNNNVGVLNGKQLFGVNDSTTNTTTVDNNDNNKNATNSLPFSAELPPLTPTSASPTTSTTSSITTIISNTSTKFNTIKQATFENNKKVSTATLPPPTNTKKSISSPYYTLSNGSGISKPNINNIQQKRRRSSSSSGSSSNYSSSINHQLQGLPANARNALLAHKTQQKQLLILQEQLQMHQRLIAQQQEMKERSLSSTNSNMKNKLPPILGQYDTTKSSHHNNKSSLLKELEDKAISAP